MSDEACPDCGLPKGVERDVRVSRESSTAAGNCNGCTRTGDYSVWRLRLRGVEIRLCGTCVKLALSQIRAQG